MAGDWIKIRDDLPEDPAVIAMALDLKVSEFEVVGMLVKFWAWVDRQMATCNAPGVTKTFLERYIGVTGFANSLEKVGWLRTNSEGIEIPNFERHLANSAKSRALTAVRVAKHRNAPNVTLALPEKRREEKRDDLIVCSSEHTRERDPKTLSREEETEIAEFWNMTIYPLVKSHKIRLPLTDERRLKLKLRLDETPDLFSMLLNEAKILNDFAKERGFITFDYILSPKTLTKVLEGQYRIKEKRFEKTKASPEELDAAYQRQYKSKRCIDTEIQAIDGIQSDISFGEDGDNGARGD